MSEPEEYPAVSLNFDEREVLADDNEPSRFIHHHVGELRCWSDREEDTTIGWFKAIYLDLDGAVEEQEPIFEVFDSQSTTLDYFNALYGTEGRFERAMDMAYGAFSWLWAPNLLILDRLEVLPAHRGKGIGLIALTGLIRALRPGAGLVAMKPFPLQCESRPNESNEVQRWNALALDSLPKDYYRAVAALRRYYKRLGFKRLPGTDLMIRAAQTKLPDVRVLYRK